MSNSIGKIKICDGKNYKEPPAPTPTNTVTSNNGVTPTPTNTATPNNGVTPTPTNTATKTPTNSSTVTLTPTKTVTPTKTSSSLAPPSQPLFDKSSWLSVPQPYLGYLNLAADRWTKYIKYNAEIYVEIKKDQAKQRQRVWNGLCLDLNKFDMINNPMSITIASCGPLDAYDLDDEKGIKCNSATFQLVINDYFKNIYTAKDWVDILTHEFGHALGIGAFWQPEVALKTGVEPPVNSLLNGNTYINAKNAYNSITSLTRTKIPLSPDDDGHWPEEYRSPSGNEQSYYGFSNELMVPSFSSGKISILSLLSIKTLVDLGYEEVSPGSSEGIPNVITSISSFSVVNNVKIIKRNCSCNHKPIMIKLAKENKQINLEQYNINNTNNSKFKLCVKPNDKIKICDGKVPTKTPTATPRATTTPTATPRATTSLEATVTPTATLGATVTPTTSLGATVTPTPSISPTNTVTPTTTPTNTVTPSISPTKTVTTSLTPTKTRTPSITKTNTTTPTPSITKPSINNILKVVFSSWN